MDAPLFALVARVAQRRVGEFKAQDLANTAWAFATADQSDTPLFVLVAREAQRRVGEFNAQDLAHSFAALLTECEQRQLAAFSQLLSASRPCCRVHPAALTSQIKALQ